MPPSISDPAAIPETAPEPAPQSGPSRRFLWPAEYYAGPTPKGVLPPWASYGCGALSLAILLTVFAGGVWLNRGGAEQLVDLSFGMTMGNLRGMYTSEVTDAQKKALEQEVEILRENVRSGHLAAGHLTRLSETVQKAIDDEKVDGREVEEVTEAARKANRRVSKSQSLKVSETARRAVVGAAL